MKTSAAETFTHKEGKRLQVISCDAWMMFCALGMGVTGLNNTIFMLALQP